MIRTRSRGPSRPAPLPCSGSDAGWPATCCVPFPQRYHCGGTGRGEGERRHPLLQGNCLLYPTRRITPGTTSREEEGPPGGSGAGAPNAVARLPAATVAPGNVTPPLTTLHARPHVGGRGFLYQRAQGPSIPAWAPAGCFLPALAEQRGTWQCRGRVSVFTQAGVWLCTQGGPVLG